jgi:hypothetical protein
MWKKCLLVCFSSEHTKNRGAVVHEWIGVGLPSPNRPLDVEEAENSDGPKPRGEGEHWTPSLSSETGKPFFRLLSANRGEVTDFFPHPEVHSFFPSPPSAETEKSLTIRRRWDCVANESGVTSSPSSQRDDRWHIASKPTLFCRCKSVARFTSLLKNLSLIKITHTHTWSQCLESPFRPIPADFFWCKKEAFFLRGSEKHFANKN